MNTQNNDTHLQPLLSAAEAQGLRSDDVLAIVQGRVGSIVLDELLKAIEAEMPLSVLGLRARLSSSK